MRAFISAVVAVLWLGAPLAQAQVAYERTASGLVIPLECDDGAGVLRIGARLGGFPGMLERRTFHVVRVRPGHGIGIDPAPADRVVTYAGRPMAVDLRQ